MTFSQMQNKYFLSSLPIVKETVEGREMAGSFRHPGSNSAELRWITPVRPAEETSLAFREATVPSGQR